MPESSLALEKRQNRREANPREGAVRRLAEVGSLKEVDPPRRETDERQRFYDLTATGRQVVARDTATPKATRGLRAYPINRLTRCSLSVALLPAPRQDR